MQEHGHHQAVLLPDVNFVLRFFPVDNYLVFYKTDDETETVYVVRIMYGGRDVHKQLSQDQDFITGRE